MGSSESEDSKKMDQKIRELESKIEKLEAKLNDMPLLILVMWRKKRHPTMIQRVI
jgi:TolA-binding protein